MKIGYPCVNESLDCTSATTFRLASYSEERLVQTVEKNLACLRRILEYNLEHGFLFFRMSSELVPFASHEINTYNWQQHFQMTFRRLGDFIKKHGMRISMHPDQFVVLNSPDERIVRNSIAELVYQATVMDLMGLDSTAKLQIHAGGVYGDKPSALKRFIQTYQTLPENVKARLVVENDDRLYSLRDCLELNAETGIPILFDNFHHECLHHGEPMAEALQLAAGTWHPQHDGVLMMDYSSQSPGDRKGKHVTSIETDLFREFLTHLHGLDVDIMLEIKDKEASCLRARQVLEELALV
ncbi:UV DNA damage repair endonuclease UvsE [Rufibacter sp. XAAS-G3-1]|uniref:UV DNA damage repair endonuclease UvsE n=1 Tax=Rufibacter sp. XAAS-G3-1 TaxID=2729134 RepID=UPI0015E7D51A|nr:UV DNA damage repair endonuclease UvsE [Rufibacter sp. XAAS-G3-1]